ncbi:MAG: IS3 family transposase [Caldilineaceae bacterium]
MENGSKKNFRTQVINHAHTANQPAEQRYTLTELCGYFGISRQAHYQLQWRQAQRTAEAETIVAAVQTIRHRHRRMGTRKLWKELPNTLAEQGIHIGRDRLFALLRQRNLLVPRVRRPHRTTWAGLWRCDNLLAAKVVTAPNQAWVSDITYILTDVGFRYLVLITDVFSRRIMGFDLSDSLTVDGLTRALDMALAQVPGRPNGLIFHSDHGTQYTCHAFRQQLAHHHIRSSMGEVGNAYDNALAERINGILKLEYGLDGCFLSHQQALRAIRQAVYLYNVERPHLALNYQKPEQLYHHYIRFSLN